MPHQTPPHLCLRPARFPEDAVRIAEIVGEVWHGGGDALLEARYGQIGAHPWQHVMAESVLSWMQAPNAAAFVVEDTTLKDQVVAFTSLQIDRDRDTGTVGYNAVARSHQGQRIGHLMMDHIMNRIRESSVGHAAVMVADNDDHAPARRVYEKHGFETVYSLRYMFRKLT